MVHSLLPLSVVFIILVAVSSKEAKGWVQEKKLRDSKEAISSQGFKKWVHENKLLENKLSEDNDDKRVETTRPIVRTMVPNDVTPKMTTLMPTTLMPTTLMPTTLMPTTLMPTTLMPTTLMPTTLMPTTVMTTTTTESPTTVTPNPDPLSWECTHAGVMCSDCQTVALCLATSSGYQQTPMERCTAGKTCSHSLQTCSTTVSPCQGAPNFLCHSEGYFPDPYDCNVYYHCGPSSGIEYPYLTQHFCPPRTGFSAYTANCSVSIESNICDESPVPPCTHPLQAAPLKENPNMYYVCVKGYPKIYQCPNKNEVFNSINYDCEVP